MITAREAYAIAIQKDASICDVELEKIGEEIKKAACAGDFSIRLRCKLHYTTILSLSDCLYNVVEADGVTVISWALQIFVGEDWSLT